MNNLDNTSSMLAKNNENQNINLLLEKFNQYK